MIFIYYLNIELVILYNIIFLNFESFFGEGGNYNEKVLFIS